MLPGVRTVITDSTYRLTAPSIERHHRAHGVIVGSSETNGTLKLDDAMTALNRSLGDLNSFVQKPARRHECSAVKRHVSENAAQAKRPTNTAIGEDPGR